MPKEINKPGNVNYRATEHSLSPDSERNLSESVISLTNTQVVVPPNQVEQDYWRWREENENKTVRQSELLSRWDD